MAFSGGVDWVAKQAALQQWVVACTGIAADHVIWGQQQAPRPAQPGIVLQLNVTDDTNTPWVDTETNPLVIATITVTSVDHSANTFTKVAHGLLTGDGPIRMSSTGTLPGNITDGVDYWVIRVNADTFKLADGFVNAMNGVAVDLADAGTGTITLDDTSETLRAGEEITYLQRSMIKAVLTLESYTTDGVGLNMATALLWRVAAKRLLPTPIAILQDAGIGVIEAGRVRVLAGTQDQYLYEPRAMMDVLIHIASEDSENGGIIERAEITGEDPEGNVIATFTVDAEQ